MALSTIFAGKNLATRGFVPTRVLVVDDEPLILWSICMALDAAGFDAVGARSADEARLLAAEWPPPRVAVMDVTPDGRGREIMDELGGIYPDCRFLVMSTARRNGAAAAQPGAVRIVEKPFDLAEIVRLVTDAVQPEVAPCPLTG